jgi:chemotaxis protein methyltransferase CheR
VKDSDCVDFLQWALPRLRLRWPGYRRVRGQACKRIRRRMTELSCADTGEYRRYLERHAEEWILLDALCRITVTRFYRDRQVFRMLIDDALPELARAALARNARTLRIWSAGCGSGEEPYTIAIGWRLEAGGQFPGLTLDILATDADAGLLSRAATACYAEGAVRNLPPAWRCAAFDMHGDRCCLRPEFRTAVRFLCHDVRTPLPARDFDLVCCRNLAFTYFAADVQREVASAIHDRLLPGGMLLLGIRERLPEGEPAFEAVSERLALYRKPAHSGRAS